MTDDERKSDEQKPDDETETDTAGRNGSEPEGDSDETDSLFDGEPDDREDSVDDPFAELGAGVDDSGLGGDASDLDLSDPDLSEPDSSDPDLSEPDSSDPDPNDPDASDSDPFAEFSEGAAGTETDADLEDAFERMDVGSAADEDVWESLDEDLAGDSAGPAAEPNAGEPSQGSGPTAASGTDAGVEHVVDKRSYCQQCPHFTPPPDVACDHEGTTIAEVIGFDEFRVRNCPMVSDDDPTFEDRR